MSCKYSIWLVPPQPHRDRLQSLINTFCELTNTPKFVPHITLLGDIPHSAEKIQRRISTEISHWQDVHISMEAIAQGDKYFMSLYILVLLNTELQKMRQSCHNLFVDTVIPDIFTPHISLAYGPICKRTKEKFAHAIQEYLLPLSFIIDRVQIVQSSNDTPIESWQQVREIPFRMAT